MTDRFVPCTRTLDNRVRATSRRACVWPRVNPRTCCPRAAGGASSSSCVSPCDVAIRQKKNNPRLTNNKNQSTISLKF